MNRLSSKTTSPTKHRLEVKIDAPKRRSAGSGKHSVTEAMSSVDAEDRLFRQMLTMPPFPRDFFSRPLRHRA